MIKNKDLHLGYNTLPAAWSIPTLSSLPQAETASSSLVTFFDMVPFFPDPFFPANSNIATTSANVTLKLFYVKA